LRVLTFTILLLVSSLLYSQSKELEFKVVKPKTTIEIISQFDFLILNCPNKIRIKKNNKDAILRMGLIGGEIEHNSNGDTLLFTKNNNGKGVKLVIYDISIDSNKVIYTQHFDVVNKPQLYIGNDLVVQDENTFKGMLTNRLSFNDFFYRQLEMRLTYKGKLYTYDVKEFIFGSDVCGYYKGETMKGNIIDKNIDRFFSHSECLLGRTPEEQSITIERIKYEIRPGELWFGHPVTLNITK
jgi:hypothetical protein